MTGMQDAEDRVSATINLRTEGEAIQVLWYPDFPGFVGLQWLSDVSAKYGDAYCCDLVSFNFEKDAWLQIRAAVDKQFEREELAASVKAVLRQGPPRDPSL